MTKTSNSLMDCLKRIRPIESEIFEEAQKEAETSNVPLEQLLIQQGVVSDSDLALATADYLEIRPISLASFAPETALVDLMPRDKWKELKALPVSRLGTRLAVAMADPFDIVARDTIASSTDSELVPLVALESEITEAIESVSNEPAQALEDILKDMAEDGDVEVGQEEIEDADLDQMLETAGEAPVIRIVNSILIEALRKHASDIHIEPMEKTVRLRNRIDGVLYESPSPPKNLQNAITSRLKIMSSLDIAERRVPQDGRFKIKALGKEVDVRMSMLPTVHGEKVVMRILDKTALAPNLGALGLDQLSLDNFSYALGQPYGMILVTGPTGSGKTTTLYSALQELNVVGTNIITTENPVEYQLDGINQVQINPQVGLTFAAALRSILRQDPDVVMVGEIRDAETATIAVEAALTGHLVLSTLHTNDAAGAIARLIDMGIEPFMLSSSLLLTQAQRLYRKLCPVCKKEIDIPTETLKKNRVDPEIMENTQFYKTAGCPKCNGIGYKGRGGIMEILLVDEAIRKTVLNTPEADAISKVAIQNGMRTLREAGLDRVRSGLTTIEEIMRVTSEH
ncbi:GspE/PulE family protein [Pontiella sulfatireligans]|uniref:Type II secretion system protein E n=1 Tax=Pontiella sulfatireligans TaxID=2750658 RepID=A0A6C2UJE4_9BACT|nr:ATPase, T2SS/T4P/T4SS family [Pontiella sulfatireligans]VGO20079.1 Type II secretion system protein E [Pontiella sulfatireligans]